MKIEKLSGFLGRSNYLAWGREWSSLTDNLISHAGLRQFAEKKAIKISLYKINKRSVMIPEINAKILSAIRINQFHSGFLLITEKYKQSFAVGSVIKGNSKKFIKILPDENSAFMQQKQDIKLEEIYKKSTFETLRSKVLPCGILEYPLISNYRLASKKELKEVAKFSFENSLNQDLSEIPCFEFNLDDAATFLIESANKKPYLEYKIEFINWLQSFFFKKVKMYPQHGDLTPWNFIVSSSGRKYLIDSDYVDIYPLAFDYIFSVTHVNSLQNRKVNLIKLLAEIKDITAWDLQTTIKYFYFSTVFIIRRHVENCLNFPENYQRNMKMLNFQIALVHDLFKIQMREKN